VAEVAVRDARRIQLGTGYATAVTDEGTGPAVVLVHGTPLDQRAWAGLEPLLRGHFRVVSYDLRGHGTARDCPPTGYPALSHDLIALLDRLGIDRAHLIGHSYGGQVVQTAALAYPERISALTLVCTRSSPVPAMEVAADQIARSDGNRAVTGTLSRWFSPAAIVANPPAVRYARSCITDIDEQVWANALRTIGVYDVAHRLGDIDAPVQLVAAEHDAISTPAIMRDMTDRLRHGRLDVLAGAWHMAPVESPERLAEILLRH
jgi:3-oxoadipate enol-lactonase